MGFAVMPGTRAQPMRPSHRQNRFEGQYQSRPAERLQEYAA
jgi:hypothetical protein